MILDRLENASMYRGLGARIAAALDYLCGVEAARLSPGRYELDGDRLVAIVQRYRTKPLVEAVWEAHRRYFDVQYVAEGIERMGYVALDARLAIRQPYDAGRDVVFFDAWGDLFEVAAGSFAVFAPRDVHAPGLVAGPSGEPAEVLKVVVKCQIEP